MIEADGYRNEVPYNREFPVNGLYGDYVQIFCGVIGESDAPYVFLLTEDGRGEYIDVLTCLRARYFCASGPLFGVEDVKKFTSDSDDNGVWNVYAVARNGEKKDLRGLIEVDQHSMSDSFIGEWGCSRTVSMDGGSYDEFVSLKLTDCENVVITSSQLDLDTVMECNGYLKYLGMMESGVVYYYQSWWIHSNGSGIEGVIALNTEYDYSENTVTCILNITELGGTLFIGEKMGEMTSFVRDRKSVV